MTKADIVICTARLVKQEILKMGINPDRVNVVVIGGVDQEKFHPAVKEELLRTELGISPRAPVIISTRALNPLYDVRTLIKAGPLILSELPGARFIIAGGGKQDKNLRALAAKLGILPSIVFTGRIEHDKLPVYLSLSDIYVSTSLSDGTSNSLLEAMACGLAPVVSDIPANREWIDESENGFFFPIRDHLMLSKKVNQLLGNRSMLKSFGKHCRNIVESRANPEREMQKLEAIYRQLTQVKEDQTQGSGPTGHCNESYV